MSREEISNSIAKMILDERPNPMTSAIQYYNHWIQKTGISITDPDTVVWTLGQVRATLTSDLRVLSVFVNEEENYA